MLQLLWFPFSSVTFFSSFTKSRHFFLRSQNASVFPGSDWSVTGTSLLLSGEKEDRTAIALFIGNLFQRSGFLTKRKVQKAGWFWLNTHCECDRKKENVKIAGQFCFSTHCDLVVLDTPFWREMDLRLLPLWILSQISLCSFQQKGLAKILFSIWNQSHLISWRRKKNSWSIRFKHTFWNWSLVSNLKREMWSFLFAFRQWPTTLSSVFLEFSLCSYKDSLQELYPIR